MQIFCIVTVVHKKKSLKSSGLEYFHTSHQKREVDQFKLLLEQSYSLLNHRTSSVSQLYIYIYGWWQHTNTMYSFHLDSWFDKGDKHKDPGRTSIVHNPTVLGNGPHCKSHQ